MERLPLLFSLALFISCGHQEIKTNSENPEKIDSVSKNSKGPKITFYKVNSKAILLGNNIKLLDENFKELMDISFLNEQFVQVLEVSDKYHKATSTDDYCQEFKYVKIKTNEVEGYLDGRNLFEPIKDIQNKVVKIRGNEVSLFATNYFGIGVSDDDGLTGCFSNKPVVFIDKNAKYEGLVKMVKNENYKNDYPFFELKADIEAYDEISEIDQPTDNYLIKIKRQMQEGGANLLVSISKDTIGRFVAEILKYEKTEE